MVDHKKKAQRINRVKNSFNSEEDVLYWLPEIDAIYDEEIREATLRTFMKGCPDYFLTKPTSSTGKYHSPDERGKYGNLIHTKRVFAAYANMSESYLEVHEITERQREAGKAAALLHDMMKYGWPSEGREHTTNEHDVIGAEVARHIGGCSNEVYRLIHGHMGPWGEGPTPSSENEWLLHLADKSASGIEEDNLAVYHPSDELVEAFPHLNAIDHDSEEPV